MGIDLFLSLSDRELSFLTATILGAGIASIAGFIHFTLKYQWPVMRRWAEAILRCVVGIVLGMISWLFMRGAGVPQDPFIRLALVLMWSFLGAEFSVLTIMRYIVKHFRFDRRIIESRSETSLDGPDR